jgi:hypothetical protein
MPSLTVDFVDGDVLKVESIMLTKDTTVEGIEYFQVVLGVITTADTAETTVDSSRGTATVYILDRSSK